MTDQPSPTAVCIRCHGNADSLCCTAHKALLCHRCYRQTHFVEVCVAGCTACARENLPVILTSQGSVTR